MVVLEWLCQFHQYLLQRRTRNTRNAVRHVSAQRQTQLQLESLEDRLAPSADLSLAAGSIVPNVSNGTAQLTLTAQVGNPGSAVNGGVMAFTVAGVSGQGNVANGMATTQLTVPIQNVLNGFTVGLSYTNPAAADSSTSIPVSTSAWNALLPANLTFDANSNEQVQFTMANQSLFGASYSLSTGLLSQVQVGSLSESVTYSMSGNNMVAAVGNVPWGMLLYDANGQFEGVASVTTSADGTPEWAIYNANGQLVAELPYDLFPPELGVV